MAKIITKRIFMLRSVANAISVKKVKDVSDSWQKLQQGV